ncbi:MAG: hypothetical protein CME70_07790 [Halobacteriovorax sp.]|nr:hypothetical protein [Halobacteriovorax sp.]|tara:strand:- start:278718 stop:279158 length:441 start_codon:yes stop_codon:yes gene_type:complete
MKIFIYLLLPILIMSCNQDQGPEQVLRSYVNLRFQKGDNLKALIDKTTGELKADLESLKTLGEEARKKFDQSSQFKKKTLKVISRDCNKKTCKITYIISYEKESSGNPYNAEIRNVANLSFVDGVWKIGSIGGLKSYFESKKDIEP